MISGPDGLADRLRANRERVLSRVAAAALRAGRDPGGVTLVAVTKSVPAAVARVLAEATGARDFGENRVAAGLEKKEALASVSPPVRWHLIGHLQTNKARRAVETFDVIHSVDSLHLAAAIGRAASAAGRIVNLFVQVNVSGESTKSGFEPGALPGALRAIRDEGGVHVLGLMTMAPFSEDPEAARPVFRALRELAAAAEASGGAERLALSMGMSQDFEIAVEEGATHLRVGTALFDGIDSERLPAG